MQFLALIGPDYSVSLWIACVRRSGFRCKDFLESGFDFGNLLIGQLRKLALHPEKTQVVYIDIFKTMKRENLLHFSGIRLQAADGKESPYWEIGSKVYAWSVAEGDEGNDTNHQKLAASLINRGKCRTTGETIIMPRSEAGLPIMRALASRHLRSLPERGGPRRYRRSAFSGLSPFFISAMNCSVRFWTEVPFGADSAPATERGAGVTDASQELGACWSRSIIGGSPAGSRPRIRQCLSLL